MRDHLLPFNSGAGDIVCAGRSRKSQFCAPFVS
jgi:hypothetical protein